MLWPSHDRQPLSQQDRIVAVMGPTGAGKSTFIDIATGQDGYNVSHGMKSHTSDIRAVRVQHPADDYPVVFIDTPGFDDTLKSDTEILAIIANWLMKIYKENVNLTTILYLHRITDNRMSASLRNNINMFTGLCGQTAMPNVILATTMWGELRKEEIGIVREEELKRVFWKDMVADGCRIRRFENTHESAWDIIGSLADKSGAQLQLLSEMANDKRQINETTAGIAATKELGRSMTERKDIVRILGNQVKKQPVDRIVVVMGPTGAGKSTLIEYATGQDSNTVGHSWQSHTSEIRTVRAQHPAHGYPVVFVDTPGFDDTFKSDTEILAMIADWLVKTYKEQLNIATILYLHRISDNRMSGSAMKNLRVFTSLCGQKAMPNVVIVTTMWGYVQAKLGARREEDLKREVWKDMLGDGCTVERFEATSQSAWRIIDSRAEKDRARILLSREIVDARLRLNETQAGVALNKELEALIRDRQQAGRRIREEAKNQNNELLLRELNAQQAEIEENIRQTAEQLLKMKIPFTRKIRLFFKDRPN